MTAGASGDAPYVVQISAGAFTHNCARMSDGTVRCWGWNTKGALGDGTKTDSPRPVQVLGLTNVIHVAAGADYTCAVVKGGEVYCWGDNTGVQFGGAAETEKLTPTPVVVGLQFKTLSAGGTVIRGLAAGIYGDSVYCWGSGGLGNGTAHSTTPVRVIQTALQVAVNFGSLLLSQYGCALFVGGAVQCWGFNFNGQLGTGATIDHSTPYPVQSLVEVTAITAGNSHACALTKNRRVYCWGAGLYGDGATVKYLPTLVEGL